MSDVFDLYGVDAPALEDARRTIERALSISLSRHESAYRGGEHFRSDEVETGQLVLQRNHDAVEDAWMEPDHQDAPFLLYVDRSSDPDAVRERLEREPSIRRLRHRVL